jgi:hypothetical protein
MNHMLLKTLQGLPGGAEMIEVGGVPVFIMKNQPTAGDVHVNGVLTNVAISFMQKPEAFVADRVFPNIPVAKQSDLYRVYPRDAFYRDEMEKVAPGTRSKAIGYELSSDSYFCHVWGLNHPIPDQVRANADADVNLELNATKLLTGKAMLNREISWAASYFTTGIWTSNRNGVASGEVLGTSVRHWSDPNSTPVEDIRRAKQAMQLLTGLMPNKLTLGREVYDALVDHPDIIDRVKYATSTTENPAKVNRRTLAALFEIDEILIMDSVRNTAKEGQTLSLSRIGGKHALLTYSPPAASTEEPSAGYTFSWTGYMGATAQGARILRYRDQPIKSDVVEIEQAYAQKVTAADLGYFFNGIVA